MKRIRSLLTNKRGFTLIEILIVIVILGVMAGFAVPIYLGQTQKVYQQEALHNLGTWRESALRYYASNGSSYTNMSLTNMDYNPNLTLGGQTVHFEYAVTTADTGTLLLTATRNTVDSGVSDGDHAITIDQAGAVVKGASYQ